MRFPLPILSCTCAALLMLAGCDKEPKDSPKKAPLKVPETASFMPKYGTFSTQIAATASVQPSPDGIVTLSAPAPGTVEKIHVAVGDKISSHSSVVTIRSSDVSDVQSDRLSAKAAYTQAKHVYEMNQELFKLGAITANDLAASQTALKQSEAMEKGYSQKLDYFGATSNQAFTLRSPIDGVVYEINTHLGEKVADDAAQPLVKIANPRKKTIVATVYEKDISAFYVGKQVHIAVENQELPPMTGRVTYVSDVLDPENKTTKIYIRPDTDASGLKINMFVSITADAEKKEVFQIPKKSLLYKEGKFVVYVKEKDRFSPLNVTLISDDPHDSFSLIKGLPQNTPIALEAIMLERQ